MSEQRGGCAWWDCPFTDSQVNWAVEKRKRRAREKEKERKRERERERERLCAVGEFSVLWLSNHFLRG